MYWIPIFYTLLFTQGLWALKGPEHKSLRPLAMGNAFVAVVDNKEALYYNPAGLNLINRLGNRVKRPELGFYPRNRFDMHLNFLGAALPVGTGLDIWTLYQDHDSSFSGNLEDLQNDQTLSSDLAKFDRQPINFSAMADAEFAMHNFGGAIWTDVSIAPFLDVGIVFPQAGLEWIKADLVIQSAIAYPFYHDRLSVGLGAKLAVRQYIPTVQMSIGDLSNIQEALTDTLNNHLEELQDMDRLGWGTDLGVLWQQTPSLRFGAALQNLFMRLNKESVTPELTLGLAYSPRIFQNNFRWKRKINFALDFEDLLNDERGYKFFNKINFGGEWEQTLIPFILSGRLSAGFKGGYLTAGLGGQLFTILHYEFTTWAEEAGYYTGQKEDRYYVMKFGVGF